MKVTFEVTGVKELQGNCTRQIVRVKREAARCCLEEAEAIMMESLGEVPSESGSLASSGFVEQGSDGNCTFGYGGAHAVMNPKTGQSTDEYMVAVHERLDVVHPNGKAKFLEDPVNRHKEKLEATFMQKLRRAFGF